MRFRGGGIGHSAHFLRNCTDDEDEDEEMEPPLDESGHEVDIEFMQEEGGDQEIDQVEEEEEEEYDSEDASDIGEDEEDLYGSDDE